ncbi:MULTISPECIES: low molecular weight protein-tyrosine-phosphatase [Tenacibaculum]|uniref:low molecular weight protein-tyrosine-phosphatase n=1 Tax=Tenacibaculum TaxID=104267 RepID=UPI001F30901C|nr:MULTISPECIES: low molecular weight protein-tyrosine-phosphatase [unclassified Tenacibaculum]
MKILMVCLGNICRSPLAEGILKSKVSSDYVQVDSAGTAGYHEGELPDKRSIAVAKKYGINITDQRSRKFSVTDFDSFDVIYAMDESNYDNIVALSRSYEDKSKVKMILQELDPDQKLNVPDPYYGGELGFENVYQMLNNACEEISSKINK